MEEIRLDTGELLEGNRNLIGKNIIDRNPVSHFYSGEISIILKKIEKEIENENQ